MGADSHTGQMAEQGCTRASLTPFLCSSNAYLPLAVQPLLFQRASARSPPFGIVRLQEAPPTHLAFSRIGRGLPTVDALSSVRGSRMQSIGSLPPLMAPIPRSPPGNGNPH